MKIEQNDKSILFSETAIPDIFFTEYLSAAPGDYVKVYIYVYFIARYNKDIKINDLSKKLELPLKTIQDALKYWEDNELLLKKNQGYILRNIQEIELNKVYKPKVSLSAEDISKVQKNEKRAKAIETINNDFFQGVMSPSWYGDIDLWFNKYGFDEQVMLALFNYAYDKRALHRNYIQATADAWSKNEIRTFNDLDAYFEKQEKRNSLNSEIAKKLNLYRKLTTYEEEDIVKWTENYGFSMDIIEIALKRASSNNKVRFDYIDSLLTDWHNKELHSKEEVDTYLQSIKDKDKKSNSVKKLAFEYTQSTFDNLDSLYDN